MKRHPGNIFISLIIMIFHIGSNAQDRKIDSLKAKLSSENNDTAKVTILLKLGSKYDLADSGVFYSSLALKYARRSGYKNKISVCLSNLGYYYLDLQKMSEALTSFKEALSLYE